MRFLQRLWTDEGFWNSIVLALKLYRIGRPYFLKDLDRLVGPFAAFFPRHSGRFVFIRRPSDAESDRSRPADRISSVVNWRASKTGLYQGRLRTPVPRAMRLVCAAANVSVSMGSSTFLY